MYEYNQVEIGDRIANYRRELGLTQKDVYEQLGVKQGVYSCYENGKTDIPMSKFAKIASIFDVSTDWLLGIDAEPELDRREQARLKTVKKFIISQRRKKR